ncbi:MAG: hypothetical protein JWP12_2996 [Bacteroidetes bacterium]|nr:hypothetical protein [Bacteroidota bacterium]
MNFELILTIIKKILLSLIILLLVLFGLSKLYDFALHQNVNLKAAYVQKEKINADILIHGPCEPLWMISPAQLDKITGLKSYNLALSHSDFADNYLHLYFYLKNNKAPEYLFLYVTPESMDLNYNTFNTYRFASYLGDPVVDSVVQECDPAYYKWSKIPFMKYAYYNTNINFDVLQGLKHYAGKRRIPYHADGYEPPMQVVWDNHLEEFIQLYPKGYNFKWDALREKYLCKTIVLAQQHGIRVCLYESPVLKEALPYQPNRKEILDRIKALADKYDVWYLKFEGMKIAESRKYYMSTLNTNSEGSRIFTDTLGKRINGIINYDEFIRPHL